MIQQRCPTYCICSDGYKVVFSWKEVFNSKPRDSKYILTEMVVRRLVVIEQRIALVPPSDHQQGLRYSKCLAEILIRKVECYSRQFGPLKG